MGEGPNVALGDVPCRACGNVTSSIRFVMRGYALHECERCQSLTAATSLDEDQAKKFYDSGYFHGGDYEDYEASQAAAKRNFRRFVAKLRRVQEGGRLLELGCAYGYFLDLAQSFWQVRGIDVSEEAIASCSQRFGKAVWCGDFLRFPAEPGGYDWVVGWDMIEHLARPREYVARATDLLKPGGHLALTTGDVRSWVAQLRGRKWRLLTPPSHLTYFSRKGMRLLLEAAGLKLVSFSTAGYDRTLAHTCFRVLGSANYRRLSSRHPWIERELRAQSFYLDLGDIMFVSAEKSAVCTAVG